MTSSIDVIGLSSEVLVWQALVLTFISFAVGLLGGFVGLALGTMRLPSLLLMGVAAPTAGEYQRTLEEVFPANVVRVITAAFNRACYGRHPAPREQIDEMRTALEGLSAEGGGAG